MGNTDDFKPNITQQQSTTEEIFRRVAAGASNNTPQDSIAALENFAYSVMLHFIDGSTVVVSSSDLVRAARSQNLNHLPERVQRKAREGLDILAASVNQDDTRVERVQGVTQSILGIVPDAIAG